jgi:hypothetical protein
MFPDYLFNNYIFHKSNIKMSFTLAELRFEPNKSAIMPVYNFQQLQIAHLLGNKSFFPMNFIYSLDKYSDDSFPNAPHTVLGLCPLSQENHNRLQALPFLPESDHNFKQIGFQDDLMTITDPNKKSLDPNLAIGLSVFLRSCFGAFQLKPSLNENDILSAESLCHFKIPPKRILEKIGERTSENDLFLNKNFTDEVLDSYVYSMVTKTGRAKAPK